MLLGRLDERRTLDGVIEDVRSGRSRTLVIRGEAGVGKTELCELLAEAAAAAGCRVARITGVQSEIELAYAALHQLCGPMLDRLGRLPGPQRDALSTVFALAPGPPPDRFLVGLAVLSLLADATSGRPLVCIVDDAHWLDRASAQALAFVARRLHTESIALVFAVRTRIPAPELDDLPALVLGGLTDTDAAELLASVVHAPLDERIRERIVAETRGNPLAILELSQSLSADELASGHLLPAEYGIAGELEAEFGSRLVALPDETRELLLVASAEAFADPATIHRAARRLGLRTDAVGPAVRAGLCRPGPGVRFRHPLVRSAVYRSASATDLQRVHGALAEATSDAVDDDQHVWHSARAADGPDETLASALELAAARSLARGAPGAAASLLRLAIDLSADPAARARRALIAVGAELAGGEFGAAGVLLAIAQTGPLDEHGRHLADVQRARIAFATERGRAAKMLLDAASRFEPVDPDAAFSTYIEAIGAALFAGAGRGVGALDVAKRAAAMPHAEGRTPTGSELLLRGVAEERGAEHDALMHAALATFGEQMDREADGMTDGAADIAFAPVTAMWMWDDDLLDRFSAYRVAAVRATGAVGELPLALLPRIFDRVFIGDFVAAATLVDEVNRLVELTRARLMPFGELALAAWRGDEAVLERLVSQHLDDALERGEGSGVAFIHWTQALLWNSLGRADEALGAAQRSAALRQPLDSAGVWGLVELVEAAAHTGDLDLANAAVTTLAEYTRAAGTDWGLGVEGRARALVSTGAEAEHHFRLAIERLGRTRIRTDLARTQLAYGEWLRRERRNREARLQLSAARELFEQMGAEVFAERAARELRASGATPRRRTVSAPQDLTPQEEQITRLVGEGLSNPEIASRLFLSTRTVEYHLHKVFTKLRVTSRHQLAASLTRPPAH